MADNMDMDMEEVYRAGGIDDPAKKIKTFEAIESMMQRLIQSFSEKMDNTMAKR